MKEYLFVVVVCAAGCLVRFLLAPNSQDELATVRQRMSERRRAQREQDPSAGDGSSPPSQPTAPDTTDEAAHQERDELIMSSLYSLRVDHPENGGLVENAISKAPQGERPGATNNNNTTTEGNIIVRSYRAATSSSPRSTSTNGKRECCICLDVYKPGEIISWPKSDQCNHIFHQECAVEWLRTHDGCPLCRTKIVNINV